MTDTLRHGSRSWRKKPVVIEAVQWNGELAVFKPWMDELGSLPFVFAAPLPGMTIKTLEGDMRAEIGDWIIRGVKGEFYPCKPDIFAATYEPGDTPRSETTPNDQLAEAKFLLGEWVKRAEAHSDTITEFKGGYQPFLTRATKEFLR
jgi:hypothetical protein